MRNTKGQFLPGTTGNPGGRPSDRYAELARSKTESALKICIEIMDDKKNRASDRLKAIEILLDRSLGRPKQSLAVSREVQDDNIEDDIRRASEMLTVMLARPRILPDSTNLTGIEENHDA